MPTHKQTTSQTQNLERTGHELTQKQRQESVLPTDVALPKGRQQQIDYIFLCVYCNQGRIKDARAPGTLVFASHLHPHPHPEVRVCVTNIFTGSDIIAATIFRFVNSCTLALLASHPVSVQKFDIITPCENLGPPLQKLSIPELATKIFWSVSSLLSLFK